MFLVAIFVLSMQMLSINASELSNQEKAFNFLWDVALFDLSRYNVTLTNDNTFLPPEFGNIPCENVDYLLESNESKIEAGFVFKNNTLDHASFYQLKGSPLYAQPQPVSVFDAAKAMLQRYQGYSGAAYLQIMKNSLDAVAEMKDMSIMEGNIKLEASFGKYTTIQWIYTSNGVDAPRKRIEFTFIDGHLAYFTGTWDIISIGNININVPKEQAISIAREAAKNYKLQVVTGNGTIEDVAFSLLDKPVDVSFSMDTREPLMLHPFWHVNVYFDKAYGSANGIAVSVWADTGEIRFCQVTGAAGLPDSQTQPLPSPSQSPQTPSPGLPQPTTSPEQSPPSSPQFDATISPEQSTSPAQPTSSPPSTLPTAPLPTSKDNSALPTLTYIAIIAIVVAVAAASAIYLKKRR